MRKTSTTDAATAVAWLKAHGNPTFRDGLARYGLPTDKAAKDSAFLPFLPLIENGASDERNFVKKGVSWALRHIGHRSAKLHTAAVKTATRLSKSSDRTERWVGKDALRDLTRPAVVKKVRR